MAERAPLTYSSYVPQLYVYAILLRQAKNNIGDDMMHAIFLGEGKDAVVHFCLVGMAT